MERKQRGRPAGTRNMKKQESPTQVIDEKVAQLLAILDNCGREQLFNPKPKKTDCDYCPVSELCNRVWNNSGYKGMEEKLNVIIKLKHGEPVSNEEMKLTNPYEHSRGPRKGVKYAMEA